MDIRDGRYQLRVADADLSASTFNRVALKGVTICKVDMSGLQVEDVTVANSNWHNVNMSGLQVTDANLSGAAISESCYTGMTIEGIPVSDLLSAYDAFRKAQPPESAPGTTASRIES